MHRLIKRLLVVGAHGDDETLGAGGTIARLTDDGVSVGLCVMTNDDGSRRVNRAEAIKGAAKALGIELVEINALGDSRLDTHGQLELNLVVERIVQDFNPDTVFTTSMADLSVDHQMVSRAVRVACRPNRSNVRELRCFEVRSSTDTGEALGIEPKFRPNCWQALSEIHMDRKLEAMRAYGNEIESWPQPRSEEGIKMLAQYRGSQVATDLAEAFEIVYTLL